MFGLATQKELRELREQLRYARRLADERWQLLQERHDAVIELIAQIPECGCQAKPKPKAKGKAK